MGRTILWLSVFIAGFLVWKFYKLPQIQYTCKVYRIDGTNGLLKYTGRLEPGQPRWSRYSGWENSFGDPTVCRFEIIRTDTIQ